MTHATRRWIAGATLFAFVLLALVAWRMPEIAAWRWRFTAGKPGMTTSTITLAAPLRWFDDYYVVADLGDNTYAIGEPRYGQCNFSYLIVGSQRALLFNQPLPVKEACAIVTALFERPSVVLVEPGEQFWHIFERLVAEARASGPLITDTSLAALAIEHGAAVCSTDRDFRRFHSLTVIDPTVVL